jgi:mRNA interferase MazF
MDLRRGDIVAAAPTGKFSKPRPVLVLQHEVFSALDTVLVAFITSDIEFLPGLRIAIAPSAENGLRVASEAMVDMLQAVPKARLGKVIGSLEPAILLQVDAAIRLLLGLP